MVYKVRLSNDSNNVLYIDEGIDIKPYAREPQTNTSSYRVTSHKAHTDDLTASVVNCMPDVKKLLKNDFNAVIRISKDGIVSVSGEE